MGEPQDSRAVRHTKLRMRNKAGLYLYIAGLADVDGEEVSADGFTKEGLVQLAVQAEEWSHE